MGSGKARYRVKGRVPCRFLGCKVPVAPVLQRSKRSVDQSPKPSESLPVSISAIFKVHLSLFFRLVFFINHLTLPAKDNIFYILLLFNFGYTTDNHCIVYSPLSILLICSDSVTVIQIIVTFLTIVKHKTPFYHIHTYTKTCIYSKVVSSDL